ncbi:MAG: TRAP transporter small permease [Anaerolineales bacterium]|nr:TRAP transporter small permease [Anaerolineales bacterium]
MKFINKLMGSLGGLLIGAMMLLIVVEVLSRHLLNSSIEGTIEVVGIFLSLAVFFGFSPCEEEDRHVKVQLFVQLLPEKVFFLLEIVVYLLAIAIVSLIGWRVGLEALSSWDIREVLPGANLQVPVYPAKIAAFIGFMAFGVQLTVNMISKIKIRIRNSSAI